MPGSSLQIRRAQGPRGGGVRGSTFHSLAVSVVFIVGSHLNLGEILSSCAARGRYDIIWDFDGRKVIDCLVEIGVEMC